MNPVALLTWVLPCALATSGGPRELHVLGYDPVDRKVFATRFGEFDEAWYRVIDDDSDWVQVKSWMQSDDWESRLPARIAALKARLQPLPDRDLDGLRLTEVIHGVVPCPGTPVDDGCRARQTTVTAAIDGRTATWTQLSLGASGALWAWDLPTGDVLLLYSHMGELYEGGYQTHRGEILRHGSPPPPPVPQ